MQQLASTRAPGLKGKKGSRSTSAFSGFIFCSERGSVYYCRRSQNEKGDYRYHTCGWPMAHGKKQCPNSGTVREADLVERIRVAASEVFADADAVVAAAIERAEKQLAASRTHSTSLREQINVVEKQRAALANRLRDPELPALAVRALYRELADDEGELERLQRALNNTGDQSGKTAGALAAEVRRPFHEARDRFADLRTPEQLNRFVAEFICNDGRRLVAHPDDSVTVEKQETPAEAGVSVLHIAGARSDPGCALIGWLFRGQGRCAA